MHFTNCLIVEDSTIQALALQSYLELLPSVKILAVKETFEEAVGFVQQHLDDIDLIFLDINLSDPAYDGMNLMRIFPSLPPVIITTNFIEYAVTAYEVGKVVDYLVKPYTFERLALAINRALDRKLPVVSSIDFESEFLFLKTGRKLQKFEISDIDYIEAYGIYSKIMQDNTLSVVNENISTLERRIQNPFFLRVHKSFIINIRKISSINTYHILVGDHKIPIGITFKNRLDNLLKLNDKID